ncbi:MAG: hypothetical protein BGO13_03275 [Burkholderiales bacterium 66-5]|nr:MAG: hypothetical protein BGO13_03275 [Burkholderiales bacterium 66-5]
MSFLTAINHLLNFIAPALVLALLQVAGSQLFMRKMAVAHGWTVPIALLSIVGSTVLVGGVLLLGRDGQMLTYGVLVLATAGAHWLWLRAWR